MASRILRRSGKAVVEYCQLIDWEPTFVFIVGIGSHHQETDVMKEAWPEVSLIGFEPNPKIYSLVKDTFPGLTYPCAISNKKGKSTLYTSKKVRMDTLSTLLKRDRDCHKIEVETDTLYSYIHLVIENQGLLWLDCEGSELNALEGASYLIEHIQMVNVEMTGNPREDKWCKPIDVHNWLVDHGFLQCWIHTTRAVIGQYDAIYVRREIFDPNMCSCLDSVLRFNQATFIEVMGDVANKMLCNEIVK